MPAAPAPPEDLAPLARGAAALGIALGAEQLAAFAAYRALLLEWNARFNLTAITDPAQIVTRHFLDSLTVALGVPRARWAGAPRLLDVGSGAGFPGLALAIAFPQWHVTALEATGKKVTFLRHVAAALGLARVRVLQGRAEALAHAPAERARYDVVAARALAALPTLLEYCQPFARVGGVTISSAPPRRAWLRGTGGRFAAVTQALIGPRHRILTVDADTSVERVIPQCCSGSSPRIVRRRCQPASPP